MRCRYRVLAACFLFAGCLLVAVAGPASVVQAQASWPGARIALPPLSGPGASAARAALDVARPRVAVGPGGTYAIAYEAFVEAVPFNEWRVAVARFAADGRPLGAPVFFEPEDVCLTTDVWNSDYLTHAEVAFGADGALYVAMTHGGLRDLFEGFQQGAETTLGLIAPDGRTVDLNPAAQRCVQYKPTFAGISSEYHPRLALTERDVLLVQEGRFGEAGANDPEADNSALHVIVDGQVAPFSQQEVRTVPLAILHTGDPFSRQEIHEFPDVAASGDAAFFVWQRCPYEFVVEGQDVVARYLSCRVAARRATVADGAVQYDGPEGIVSAAPDGTFSFAPSVAANAAGQRVVAWADTRGGAAEVFVQRYDAAGQPVGGNVQASAGAGVLYTRPEVAVRPDGAFAVAWSDSSAVGFRARVRRYDAAGQPLGPVATLGSGQTGAPALAVAADDYLFVWLGVGADERLTLYSSVDGQPVDAAPTTAPDVARLEAYPSPASGRATLTFGLAAPADVRLAVYDLLGRAVRRLDGRRGAGTHAVGLDLRRWAPGAYVVRLQVGDRVETRRLHVVRP